MLRAFIVWWLCWSCATARGGGLPRRWDEKKVDPEHTLVYGSALLGSGQSSTPDRYLFLQTRDAQGRNLTSSPDVTFQVRVNNEQTLPFHDRGDGTYVARIPMPATQPHTLTLAVFYHKRSTLRSTLYRVAGSPWTVRQPLVESCYCPSHDPVAWLQAWCHADTPPQLTADLQPYPDQSLTASELLDLIPTLNNGVNCFVHYTILQNRIYSKQYGPYGGFQKFVDDILLSLSRKVQLSDVEFLFNLGDWPVAAFGGPQTPVFSWCGSNDTWDIVVPTYKQTLATVFNQDLESVPEVDARCYEVGGAWGSKIEKAFFRGRDSCPERVALMQMSRQRPDLIDADISRNHMDYHPNEADRQKHRAYEAQHGPKARRLPFLEFWKYKYLLNVDGTVAAYRFPALLAGNSLVLKQDSKWYEHFYRELQPWVHYVPVRHDLSDVAEKVRWARTHDAEARKIAQRGRLYARERLRPEDVYCYYFQALEGWSKKLAFQPEVRAGMKEVTAAHATCVCGEPRRNTAIKSEL